MMLAIRKAFDLMSDDIVELSTKNETLKKKVGSYDEKCSYKPKLLKQMDHEKRAILITSKMQKQMKKV